MSTSTKWFSTVLRNTKSRISASTDKKLPGKLKKSYGHSPQSPHVFPTVFKIQIFFSTPNASLKVSFKLFLPCGPTHLLITKRTLAHCYGIFY